MLMTSLLRQTEDPAFDPCTARILMGGKSFTADATGALYWPAERTLVVADLQLSTCSYLEGEDVLLPPYDTASVFEKLEEAIDRYDPGRVIALGNSFAGLSRDALSPHQTDWLHDMIDGREWYWVVSHDFVRPPEGIGGVVVPHMMLGGIKFRAEPVRAPVANEIAGALHPVAQISQYGHETRGRCFVTNGMRMVMPAVGNYTAGTNVLSDGFDPLLGRNGLFVWMISGARVSPVASAQLIEDRAA